MIIEQKIEAPVNPLAESARAEIAIPIILSVFPENGMHMVAIAQCETRFRADAFNPELEAKTKGITDHGSWGIFQINGPQFDKWDDVLTNTLKAKEVFDKQSYGAWFHCSKKLGFI